MTTLIDMLQTCVIRKEDDCFEITVGNGDKKIHGSVAGSLESTLISLFGSGVKMIEYAAVICVDGESARLFESHIEKINKKTIEDEKANIKSALSNTFFCLYTRNKTNMPNTLIDIQVDYHEPLHTIKIY